MADQRTHRIPRTSLYLDVFLPLLELPFGFLLTEPVLLLELADELIAVAGDDIEFVVGEAPSFFLSPDRGIAAISLRSGPNSCDTSSSTLGDGNVGDRLLRMIFVETKPSQVESSSCRLPQSRAAQSPAASRLPRSLTHSSNVQAYL
jgi:hypothetical protein